MKVWVVEAGSYDDWTARGVYSTEAKADARAARIETEDGDATVVTEFWIDDEEENGLPRKPMGNAEQI